MVFWVFERFWTYASALISWIVEHRNVKQSHCIWSTVSIVWCWSCDGYRPLLCNSYALLVPTVQLFNREIVTSHVDCLVLDFNGWMFPYHYQPLPLQLWIDSAMSLLRWLTNVCHQGSHEDEGSQHRSQCLPFRRSFCHILPRRFPHEFAISDRASTAPRTVKLGPCRWGPRQGMDLAMATGGIHGWGFQCSRHSLILPTETLRFSVLR